jgi:hypothetical protein
VNLTPVTRHYGEASPWHLPHPLAPTLALCGTTRGPIASHVDWQREVGDGFVCGRCERLRAAVGLSESHVGLLSSLVRGELRRTRKKRVGLIRQFGTETDLSGKDAREELLRECYLMLGGDPDRIDNMPERVEVP